MTKNPKWTKESASKRFKEILTEYGTELSANNYDRHDIPNKPSRKIITKLFGSWQNAKQISFPESGDENKIYLVRQNKRLLAQLENQRNLTQIFIDNCLTERDKINIQPVPIPPIRKSANSLDFFALRSDAQVGQKSTPDRMHGLGFYDSDIYKKRVEKWTERICVFHDQDKKSHGLNKLVINHLGDQVEGEAIYPGQPFYLDIDLVKQIYLSVEVEASAYLTLSGRFNEIEIFCVPGNHGRPGNKGQHHNKTNFDYLFYRILASELKYQKNIKVYVSESPAMLVQHGNFLFLLNHGDNVKSYMGIPYYGRERRFRLTHDLYKMIINYELVGHHHEPFNLADKIIANGCLPGGSDLSVNKMTKSSEASQRIFYFHNKKGLNRESNLYLSDPVKLTPDKYGIYTPYFKED